MNTLYSQLQEYDLVNLEDPCLNWPLTMGLVYHRKYNNLTGGEVVVYIFLHNPPYFSKCMSFLRHLYSFSHLNRQSILTYSLTLALVIMTHFGQSYVSSGGRGPFLATDLNLCQVFFCRFALLSFAMR